MNLNISGNMTVINGQMGDTNTMVIGCSEERNVLQEQDWRDMQKLLSSHLSEVSWNEDANELIKESMSYVEKKDEAGLKGFLKRNKEGFVNNVLSNIASSGLLLLFSKLNF